MRIARSARSICGAFPLMFLAPGAVIGAAADRGAETCEYLTVVVDPSIADEAAPGLAHLSEQPRGARFVRFPGSRHRGPIGVSALPGQAPEFS